MPTPSRRSAMKVRDGRVQKKNNWRLDRDDYFAVPKAEIRIDRRNPGPGCRHLITVAQLRAFLDLLPDWDEIAIGLRAIVLDTDRDDCMGWHDRGIVAVCAWEHELWWTFGDPGFVEDHGHLFDLFGVECRPWNNSKLGPLIEVRWTEKQARAFQLLHILTHELGHHHDRMTTRSRGRSARGEPYAERYARQVMETVWPAYATEFGL